MLRQTKNKRERYANIHRTSRTPKTLLAIFGIVIIVNLQLQQIPIIKAAVLRLQENSTCEAKGERGICKTWTNCPILETLIERHEYSVETVENCGFSVRDELICCPTESMQKIDGNVTQIETNSTQEAPTGKDRPAVRACDRIRSEKTPVLSNKILGGTVAKFAHVVAILYSSFGNDGDGSYVALCGGTLIGDRFVLTAAHCVSTHKGVIPSTVRMGVSNFSDPEEMREAVEIKIKKTYIHDEYSIRHTYNDIAILELEQSVIYSDNIYPACLHTDEADPGPDVKLTASGWGVINMTTRASSNVLQKVSLHVTPLQECNDRFAKYGITPTIDKGIVRTQLCAEDVNNIKDSCQGDSGGPLHVILDGKCKTYIHDEYSIRHTYNDIAILELEQSVIYSDNIYPACLHTDEADPGPDVKLTASGWGVINMTTRASSNVLQKVSLHVTPLQECNDRFAKYGITPTIDKGIVRTQLCAEDVNNIKDSCQGDSGGPLHVILDEKLCLYSVVGVVASGFGCAVMPGLYTRVASFLDFIEPIVWPEDVA